MDYYKKFKIAISHKIQNGPYGGGNAFVSSLSKQLIEKGNRVFFDLEEKNLDFIILTDPRSRSPNVSFSANQILKYLKLNNNTLVIHRINECDERKNTKFMNLRLRIANYSADHTVFVGSWLKDLNLTYGENLKSSSVILNSVDTNIFFPTEDNYWNNNQKLKLVTHHWSSNWMKGFDIYKKIDDMLSLPYWCNKLEFTYIGNIPKDFIFKNTNHIKPVSGHALANELRKCHVYITASINEPGGNHQIEGGACGLPIIYRNSGCLPEYCRGYGLMFNDNNIEDKIEEMFSKYKSIKAKMYDFPYKSNVSFESWTRLFNSLDENRNELISKRCPSHFMSIINRFIN